MKRIIRVFPRRTALTPRDEYVFFDVPGLFIPEHDEVHVCCIFTWDIEVAQYLYYQWKESTDKPVYIDGPAFGNSGGEFVPGRYVKKGVIFTSRGCPNNCGFCLVPKREGKLREMPIFPGNIINDNNFLACSRQHRGQAYEMLRKQKAVEFKGGLEAGRLTDWDIEQMRSIRIRRLFFACDSDESLPVIRKTAEQLYSAGFKRDNLHCYVLIGDDMKQNEARLLSVLEAGMMPFAQLYQPPEWIEYSPEWRKFARLWSRPAFYMAKYNVRGDAK